MPPVRSISIGPDTVTITTQRGTRTFTRANISAAVLAQPIATIEATVNTALASFAELQGMQVRVHIVQVNPTLQWTFVCANADVTIPLTWWAKA